MTPIISLALVLQLHNVAAAPTAVVDRAAAELAATYAELGIRVEWDRGAVVDDRRAISIVVLANETGDLRGNVNSVMGAAAHTPSGAGVVYVFYGRVRSEAERYSASTALVLARTIEHEIGHLLLPGTAHAADGLMRACWRAADFRRADQGHLGYSPREAASIRQLVSQSQLLVEYESRDRARQ
jgi:hypothetical protein